MGLTFFPTKTFFKFKGIGKKEKIGVHIFFLLCKHLCSLSRAWVFRLFQREGVSVLVFLMGGGGVNYFASVGTFRGEFIKTLK